VFNSHFQKVPKTKWDQKGVGMMTHQLKSRLQVMEQIEKPWKSWRNHLYLQEHNLCPEEFQHSFT